MKMNARFSPSGLIGAGMFFASLLVSPAAEPAAKTQTPASLLF